MHQYEVLYIIKPDLEEAERNAVIERFSNIITQNGGTLEKTDEWGKRRLAYPIDYNQEGYYVLLEMTANPDFPKELERNFQISDFILRYLITRIGE